jgi:hypothetical protein
VRPISLPSLHFPPNQHVSMRAGVQRKRHVGEDMLNATLGRNERLWQGTEKMRCITVGPNTLCAILIRNKGNSVPVGSVACISGTMGPGREQRKSPACGERQ